MSPGVSRRDGQVTRLGACGTTLCTAATAAAVVAAHAKKDTSKNKRPRTSCRHTYRRGGRWSPQTAVPTIATHSSTPLVATLDLLGSHHHHTDRLIPLTLPVILIVVVFSVVVFFLCIFIFQVVPRCYRRRSSGCSSSGGLVSRHSLGVAGISSCDGGRSGSSSGRGRTGCSRRTVVGVTSPSSSEGARGNMTWRGRGCSSGTSATTCSSSAGIRQVDRTWAAGSRRGSLTRSTCRGGGACGAPRGTSS